MIEAPRRETRPGEEPVDLGARSRPRMEPFRPLVTDRVLVDVAGWRGRIVAEVPRAIGPARATRLWGLEIPDGSAAHAAELWKPLTDASAIGLA